MANPVKINFYNSDSELIGAEECLYVEDKIIEHIYYDMKNKLKLRETYRYDASGNLIETTGFDENNMPQWKTTSLYDKENNLLESASYNPIDTLEWKNIYTYKEKKILTLLTYSKDETLKCEYEYNVNGDIIKFSKFKINQENGNDKLLEYHEYIYE
jgi:hypothetical protein